MSTAALFHQYTDLVSFLGLDKKIEEKDRAKSNEKLQKKLLEFLSLRLVEDLPKSAHHLLKIRDSQELLSEIKKITPDFEDRITRYLLEYKTELQQAL